MNGIPQIIKPGLLLRKPVEWIYYQNIHLAYNLHPPLFHPCGAFGRRGNIINRRCKGLLIFDRNASWRLM